VRLSELLINRSECDSNLQLWYLKTNSTSLPLLTVILGFNKALCILLLLCRPLELTTLDWLKSKGVVQKRRQVAVHVTLWWTTLTGWRMRMCWPSSSGSESSQVHALCVPVIPCCLPSQHDTTREQLTEIKTRKALSEYDIKRTQ
jgi:hypothetical protein